MSVPRPRFIVLASLSVMLILNYFLARDEEKRMLNQYSRPYEDYRERTGMFAPKWIEGYVTFTPRSSWRNMTVPLSIVILIIGLGFALREVTLHSLLFEVSGNLKGLLFFLRTGL